MINWHLNGWAAIVALGLATGAQANWTETFDNDGTDQEWDLYVLTDGGEEVPVADWFIIEGDDNYGQLRDPFEIATPDPDAITEAYAVVPDKFFDTVVTASINLDPTVTQDSAHGLMARVDPETGTGYAFAIYQGEYGILKITDEEEDFLELIASDTDDDPLTASIDTNQTLFLEFSVVGDLLTGRVFDEEGGNLLGEISTTDDAFTMGFAGVFAALPGDDTLTTGLVLGTNFDDITATPEPTSLALLAIGGAVLLRRR